MESHRSAAHDALFSAMARLKELETTPSIEPDQVITLNAVTPFPHTFQTTFAREVRTISAHWTLYLLLTELWFAALHAVHHWSMVRL